MEIKNNTYQINYKLVNWFVFFLGFPCLSVAGNSITFYIFIAILYKVGAFWNSSYKGKLLFSLFLLVVLISALIAPYSIMPRHPGAGHIIKLGIQYVYWILVAAFFSKYYQRLELYSLAKYLFVGILCSIVGFYLIPFKVDLAVLEFTTTQSRNAFIFGLLASVPICFIYLKHRYSGNKLKAFFIFFILIALLSNGRAGAIIIVIEMLMVSTILYPRMLKLARILVLPFIGLFALSESEAFQPYLDSLAIAIEGVNPRVANMLRDEDDGDLSFDKSWSIRKLMIDKSLEIFPAYPFFGVGAGNFNYFDAELPTLYSYMRLGSHTIEYYNTRSAHNSYVQILTDFGLMGFIIFILILLRPLLFFIKQFLTSRLYYYHLPLIALLGICIHFYAISAITGAIPWMVIGLATGVLNLKNKNQVS
jgi:O-antigen ligase